MMLTESSQPVAAAAVLDSFVPADVSVQDMMLLLSSVDLSRVAHLSSPGSVSQPLQSSMQQLGLPLRAAWSAAEASAAVLVTSQPTCTAMAALAERGQLRASLHSLVSARFSAHG